MTPTSKADENCDQATVALHSCCDYLAAGEGDNEARKLVAECAIIWAQLISRRDGGVAP